MSDSAQPGALVETVWGQAQAPPHVLIYKDVLEELAYAAKRLDGTFGVVLTGRVDLSGAELRWEVTGFEGLTLIEQWDEFSSHVLSTCDELWERRDVDVKPAGLCFHAPSCAGELQEPMAFVHLSLFNMPRQPLVVLDLASDAVGVYTRPPNFLGQEAAPHKPFRNVPFTVVSP